VSSDNRIDFGIPDAIWILGNLFVKTPEALESVLAKLREIGYKVDDKRDEPEDGFLRHGRTNEELEASGWNLWYAHLDVRQGKCGSCGSYISTLGIQTHDHRCEVCGAVTYLKIIRGSLVEFSFIEEDPGFFSPVLRMPAVRWDAEEGTLYLKLRFVGGGFRRLDETNAWEYIRRFRDKWELVRVGKDWCIKVHYPDSFYMQPDDVIEMRDISRHHWNHTIVKVWEGVEYREYDRLPIPDSFSVHETWRWTLLEPSPTLHETILHVGGVVSDQGYYYQDGRPAVRAGNFEAMGVFIRHFTTLDADAWEVDSRRFRLDGPGAIADVAAWCHPEAEIMNKPNMFNTINAMYDGLSGKPLSDQEVAAAVHGAGDPLLKELLS